MWCRGARHGAQRVQQRVRHAAKRGQAHGTQVRGMDTECQADAQAYHVSKHNPATKANQQEYALHLYQQLLGTLCPVADTSLHKQQTSLWR